MQQKHLFIMDPVEKLNLALDSSLRIAFALSRHGHSSYHCQIEDLYWESGKAPACKAKAIHFNAHPDKVSFGADEALSLEQFRSAHMRKDPPFDIHYITATWFLDHCPKTLVVNSPVALRAFNEKMGTLQFPKECKQSLVSSNPQLIEKYIESHCNGDAVLKPLHLYGGKGILHLNFNALSPSEIQKQLLAITDQGKSSRMVQAFDSRIYDGEVRAFLVGGKALSWCLKVPKKGDFLANTASGATLHPYTASEALVKKVEGLAKELLKQGIYFVGLDIIGEEVSEINITSPRLLVAPGDSRDYYDDIAKWILNK